MIKSNRINVIIAVAVAFALIVSIVLVGFGNMQEGNGGKSTEAEYATKIFGTDIISIEIIADKEDWQEMLNNAISEQFIMADVIVNGTKFQNVGIRPKGNSSLTQVASSDSDRYSFRLQFDEYIKGQTCFGLESFVVNNMLGDNTYMKEYVSYELMHEIGVDAPYFGYADIKVNGENWGLYLAVELYNDSYEQRVFGDTSGMLYNVKSMDMGGNKAGNQQGQPGGNAPTMPGGDVRDVPTMPGGDVPTMPDGNAPSMPDGNAPTMPDGSAQAMPGGDVPTMPDGSAPAMSDGSAPTMPGGQNSRPQRPGDGSNRSSRAQQNSQDTIGSQPFPSTGDSSNSDPNQQPNAGGNMKPPQMGGEAFDKARGFGGRGGSSGGSLEYSDDNTSSYSAIFNNVVGKGTESDYQRVVQAIKALSEGKDLEKYFDVDQILRYLAAHTIVVNLDSYSSSMAQNYYIYERDGKITVLPWDYNLAWGGFQNGSASSVINFPIDTPVSGVEMSSRPLIEKLFSNTEYLERYHSYLQQLVDNYFANGKFGEKINALDTLISDYVKNDTTAFCTYEEYKTAISTFITLGNLRSESIQGQLDGTVPSTSTEQNKSTDQLISAGDLKLTDLGSMMGGRGGNNNGFPGRMGGQDTNTFPGGMGGQNANTFPGGMNSGMDAELMRKAMDIIRQANGDITDDVKDALTSLGLTTEQIKQISEIDGRSFGRMGQNSDNRTPPDNVGGMQWGENSNNPRRTDVNAPESQGGGTNNLFQIGVLSLILVAALLFTARFRKSY